jgi:hypothetical protein
MVKIINTGSKLTRRRLPNGRWLSFVPNKAVEVEDERLLEELRVGKGIFVLAKDVGPKVGGGVKTHVKPPKPRSKPAKSKPKKEVKSKPKKGLKKAKKGKAD